MNAIPQKPIQADPAVGRKGKAAATAEPDDVRLTIDLEDEVAEAQTDDRVWPGTDPVGAHISAHAAQASAHDTKAAGADGDAASSDASGQDRPTPEIGAQASGPATKDAATKDAATKDPARHLAVPAQLAGIEVTLTVEIGSHRLPLRDLLSVDPGQLFTLDRITSDPVSILVNGKPFAQGEIVAIGDRFGVRLLDILAPEAS